MILAHAVLVLAFSFSAVSAALDRLDPAYRQAAESLGAGPVRVLVRITLPLLRLHSARPRGWRSRCRWASSAPR